MTPSSCTWGGGNITWRNYCYGSQSSIRRDNGYSFTVNNTNPDYTGSATYTCNAGTWDVSSTCIAMGCSFPSGTRTWGNCAHKDFTSRAISSKSSLTYNNNQTSGYTGSITYYCNNGNISVSSSSCSPNPIHGVCGYAQDGNYSGWPSADALCSVGTVANKVGGGSGGISWNCMGSNGGSNAYCSANID